MKTPITTEMVLTYAERVATEAAAGAPRSAGERESFLVGYLSSVLATCLSSPRMARLYRPEIRRQSAARPQLS